MWPRRAVRRMSIFPDTSNTGPSLELALQVREQLNQRGYSGIVMEDLGHSNAITVKECLANAREHKLDAAIVVFYSGLHTWREPNYCPECLDYRSMWRTRVSLFSSLHHGYLYLPNATIFNPADESTIWSTNYYGVLQEAHLPNLSNEDLASVADLAVLPSADTDYFAAAPKTARLMFDPLFWPGSFKEFPRHPRRDRTL